MTAALLLALVVSAPLADAAISPSQQWVTSVTGTYPGAGVATFGSTGVTASIARTGAACPVGPNERPNTDLTTTLNPGPYLSPQAPDDARAIRACVPPTTSDSTTTVDFNKPLIGPILHVNNLDASYAQFSALSPGGAISLTKLKSNYPLQLLNSGTLLQNQNPTGSNGCSDNPAVGANNSGCGSYRINEAGGPVTGFTFAGQNATAGSDGWNMGLSFPVSTLTKAFSPEVIAPGDTSSLTFSMDNPDNEGAIALTGMDFTDSLPAGMTLANASFTNNGDCGAPVLNGGTAAVGDASVAVTGVDVAVGDTCTITVVVSAATEASYANTNDNLTTNVGNLVPNANATLVVAPVVGVPFGNAEIGAGIVGLLLMTAGGVFYLRRRSMAAAA